MRSRTESVSRPLYQRRKSQSLPRLRFHKHMMTFDFNTWNNRNRCTPETSSFTVPSSEEYLRELQACWRDTEALSCLTSDGRTLAGMQDAERYGLDHMPAIEPTCRFPHSFP
ncbi:hypothetical protein CRUP_015388 [Coryphaenoides rupestris]|nr:hypothetical protein CRUP_015388 [Coryphaenoides rupestris]